MHELWEGVARAGAMDERCKFVKGQRRSGRVVATGTYITVVLLRSTYYFCYKFDNIYCM